jgi:transposase
LRGDRRAGHKGIALTDFYLTDARWALIADRLPGKESDPGSHGRDNRLFIEAVFWIVRTGSSWRSLPLHFGKWYTNYTRFRRWTRKGVWPRVLDQLAAAGPCEYFYEDGAIHYDPLRPLAAQKVRTAPVAARRRRKSSPEAQGGGEGNASAPSLSRLHSPARLY